MKYALVNGERREAVRDLVGECQGCGSTMVAKCGEVKIHHWAHRGKRICDHWWENETEWHRAWKGFFPVEWQEIIHTAEDGEKHIADVKTDQGWVLEFQHSFLNPDERRSRDGFYKKLVWVVDGTRRKRDQVQFFKAMNDGAVISNKPVIRRVFNFECALVAEWEHSTSPVFFDFGEAHRIWWLLPRVASGERDYVGEFSRAEFINLHRGGSAEATQNFESFLNEFSDLVLKRNSVRQVQQPQIDPLMQLARARAFQSRSFQPRRFRRF